MIDARDHVRLMEMVADLAISHAMTAIPGDVASPGHRTLLADAVADTGGLDLLVNNASVLGPRLIRGSGCTCPAAFISSSPLCIPILSPSRARVGYGEPR